MEPAEELPLWRRYRESGDPSARERLILTYAPIAKYIAHRKARALPPWCDIEDLISCGLEALTSLVDRFDPERGAGFEQLAWTRIHGAIVDELRRRDPAPRTLRRWQRELEEAQVQFRAVHRRAPTKTELAEALSVDGDEFLERERELSTIEVVSLDALGESDEDCGGQGLDTVPSDDDRLQPERAALAQERDRAVRGAVRALPSRQRQVAELLYGSELNVAEAAAVLGVSPGRVRQINARLHEQIRGMLGPAHEVSYRS
ncbi:MAG: sigma-70 family RNA polymerase sigma factor [Actinomycetota bacterium]|nr:sigma-70 family RNA polymerase sigma factor [Actinomycetota bacterium]